MSVCLSRLLQRLRGATVWSFCGINLDTEDAKAIAEELKVNDAVHTVNLSKTNLETESAKVIAEALKLNHTVHTVNLSGNEIGTEGLEAFAEMLKMNNVIHTMNLSGIFFYDEGAKVIAEMLKVNTTIHTIALSTDVIRCEGAKAIAEVLRVNKAVHTIDLSYNDLEDEGAKAIAEMLQMNDTVHTIDLSCNQIGREGAKAIAEVLKVNSTVHTMQLRENKLGDEGAKAIAEMLQVNTMVHTIDLSYNGFGDEGARAIATMLEVNNTLHTIDLSENEIGDDGVMENESAAEKCKGIAELLKVNKGVLHINLSKCEIGQRGAKTIAEALKMNNMVHTIALSSNQVGDEGAKAITEMLKVNHTLKTIHLSKSQVGLAGLRAIAEVLKVNTTVHTIDLSGNKISVDDATGFAAVKNFIMRILHLNGNDSDQMKQRIEGILKSRAATGCDTEWCRLPTAPACRITILAAVLSDWGYSLTGDPAKDQGSLTEATKDYDPCTLMQSVGQISKEGQLPQMVTVHCPLQKTCFLVWRNAEVGINWLMKAASASHEIEVQEVHTGFKIHKVVHSSFSPDIGDNLLIMLERLKPLKPKRVVFCGHSLGGSAAQVALLYTILHGLHSQKAEVENATNFQAVTFGAPMAVIYGHCESSYFAQQAIKGLFVTRSWNFVNRNDMVPRLPGCPSYLENLLPMFSTCCSFLGFFASTPEERVRSVLNSLRHLKNSDQYRHPGTVIHLNPPILLPHIESPLALYEPSVSTNSVVDDHSMKEYIRILEMHSFARDISHRK